MITTQHNDVGAAGVRFDSGQEKADDGCSNSCITLSLTGTCITSITPQPFSRSGDDASRGCFKAVSSKLTALPRIPRTRYQHLGMQGCFSHTCRRLPLERIHRSMGFM